MRESKADRRGLRWVIVTAYIVVGGFLEAAGKDGFATQLIDGFILAAVLLALLGGVAFLWRRWRHSRGRGPRLRYMDHLTSIPVVCSSCAILLLAVVGRQS